MQKYDVVIIGGGPSGMMAAITAAKSHSVLLVEKNPSLGRKILATGNGRCNLTNRNAEKSRYHGGNPEFIEEVLKQYDQFETMKFFENLGVILKEEDNGRIFPRTNQAQTIVDTLVHKLQEDKVEVRLNINVKRINRSIDSFHVIFDSGDSVECEKVILTTGGKASSHLGSTGDGYYWAELLGHKTTPTYPALVPLETVENWPKEISGLRVEGKSSISVDGNIISEKTGDILFTHFGLSAPAVMAHAGLIAPNLDKNMLIHLDLFPELSEKELDQVLTKMFDTAGKKSLKNTLSGIIPSNLASVVLVELNLSQDKKTAEISKNDRAKIAKYLKDIALKIKQLRPFKEAQVTHGGVILDEINVESMESKKAKGLYFAGEILDVDGDSGGFNLQWAWSSGHLAGLLN